MRAWHSITWQARLTPQIQASVGWHTSASGVCDAAFTLRARFPGVGSLDAYGAPQDVPIPRAGRAVGVAASRVARLAT